MAPSGNHKGMPMWPSLPLANKIADIANFFFIGSLVVGVISTIVIVRMAGVKERYWDADRQQSAENIAALATQGEQLRKETAEANARAAEAQLALEKYKAPRSLNTEQQQRLVAAIEQFSGQEYALSVGTGAEPQTLLCQIDVALGAAGWRKVGPFGVINVDTPCGTVGVNSLSGVNVRIAPGGKGQIAESAADKLIEAFKDEQIAVEGATDPKNIPSPTAILIMVGVKP